MSKILKNITLSNISITDTGITVNASSQYTIPSQDYLLWMASSNIVTYVGNGDIVVNDGSEDLSISDGIDLIKGVISKKIIGATDNTPIGNVGDRLKVDASVSVTNTGQVSNIFKYTELSVTTKGKIDVPSMSYTVPSNKTFKLAGFHADYDNVHPVTFRLEKQFLGTGAWSTIARITIKSQPQEGSNIPSTFNGSIQDGVATDKYKITIESSLIKGSYWVAFYGVET